MPTKFRRENSFIQEFLSAYEDYSWADAEIDWLDEKIDGAVEALEIESYVMQTGGRPLGIPKTGGRKKGTPNKATAEIKLRRSNFAPKCSAFSQSSRALKRQTQKFASMPAKRFLRMVLASQSRCTNIAVRTVIQSR